MSLDRTLRDIAIKDLYKQGYSLREIADEHGLSVSRVSQIVNQDYKTKRQNHHNDRRNAEHYPDPTAYQAIRNIDQEEERFRKLLGTIFYITEIAGFHIENRITMTDKRSGRVWN